MTKLKTGKKFDLFIDPGVSKKSFAWVLFESDKKDVNYEEYGIIQLTGEELPYKLKQIWDQLLLILAERKIKNIWVENTVFYFSQNSVAAVGSGSIIKVANAVGVVLLIGAIKNIPTYTIDPRNWRGNLSDELVEQRVKKLTGKKFNEHIRDAMGMAFSARGLL